MSNDSCLKLLRFYNDIKNKDDHSWKLKDNIELSFEGKIDSSLSICFKHDEGFFIIYIFVSNTISLITLEDFENRVSCSIFDVIKTMDDIELVLKYGRNITDDYINSKLISHPFYQGNLTVDDILESYPK